MKRIIKAAAPLASLSRNAAPSLGLIKQPRTKRSTLDLHIKNMDELSQRYRAGMRAELHAYRSWRMSKEICEICAFYLDAEGKILRQNLKNMYVLYREANRDLQAMRRETKRRSPQNSSRNSVGAHEN